MRRDSRAENFTICWSQIVCLSHTQGGFLDGEAAARCTTVYLVDRRLDMLPALLSEQLCSLRAGTDRLAVSVVWTLSPDLDVKDVWFGRTIIRCSFRYRFASCHDFYPLMLSALLQQLPLQSLSPLLSSLSSSLRKSSVYGMSP